MSTDKRIAQKKKLQEARSHAAGILQAGRFVWTQQHDDIVLELVRNLSNNQEGSTIPFAQAAEVLLKPPHSWPFLKPYLVEKVRSLWDRKERKRKHSKIDEGPQFASNPLQAPRVLTIVERAIKHREECVEMEKQWRSQIESQFNHSPEPTPVSLTTFSNNRKYKKANEDFRRSHMSHWSKLAQPPQVSLQENLPLAVQRVLRSFRGHRVLPGSGDPQLCSPGSIGETFQWKHQWNLEI